MSENKTKSRGLGRGLSALMADVNESPIPSSAPASEPRRPDMVVPIENIEPNPDQPRRRFDPEHLEDLSNSIREKGVIQPLIVRPKPGASGKYEIVAGERRWRASQKAQLHELPVVVREFNDTEVLEIAIIENIQRSDLNPVEEAAGYRQLMDRFGHTQDAMSKALGKSRSHIANLLRLLNLPQDIQDLVEEGQLSSGHARALITSDHAQEIAKRIVKEGLSVRATEALVKKYASGDLDKPKKPKPVKDADTKALEGDLSANLGMKVVIDHKAGGEAGQITIKYDDMEQLDELCRILTSQK